MFKANQKPNTIDEYISEFAPDTRKILNDLRDFIKKLLPNAIECISYDIPTFKVNGKNLVHFGGFQKHIGFYPGSFPIKQLKVELKSYKTAKGSIQFPLDKPLPFELIEKIITYALNNQKRS